MPEIRSVWPSGDVSEKKNCRTSSPITATGVRFHSSCGVKKRPSLSVKSRISAISAETPMIEVASRIRLSRFRSSIRRR